MRNWSCEQRSWLCGDACSCCLNSMVSSGWTTSATLGGQRPAGHLASRTRAPWPDLQRLWRDVSGIHLSRTHRALHRLQGESASGSSRPSGCLCRLRRRLRRQVAPLDRSPALKICGHYRPLVPLSFCRFAPILSPVGSRPKLLRRFFPEMLRRSAERAAPHDPPVSAPLSVVLVWGSGYCSLGD